MKPADLEAVKSTLRPTNYPVNLIIEAYSYCNLRCLACPYPFMKRERGKMSEELFAKIIDEIAQNSPKDTIVWFAFMGEPMLLHDELFDKISFAKQKGIQNIFLNTNALLLDRESAKKLIRSGLDKVIVSVDAHSKESYEKIRIGGDYDILKNNVVSLLEEIRRSDGEKPEVIVQFIVMDENRGEEEGFKDFRLGKGATVKIRRKLGWGDSIEAKDLVIGQDQRDMPCPWLWRQMVILWDGRVAQCDADYDGEYSAGDIKSQTINEVWNGELRRRRDKHSSRDFDFAPCKTCNDWQVGLSEFYKPEK